MVRYPQALENVAVAHKEQLEASASIAAAITQAQTELGSEGRVLVRASGTEPVVRVMVEAATLSQAQKLADNMAGIVRRELA
jgi:phosphoglucosamine mutase